MAKAQQACSRREFLKVGAVVGVSAVAAGTLSACAQEQKAEEPAAPAEEPAEEKQAEAPAETASGDTIYIVDVLHAKPGDGKALFDHYMSEYAPGAQQRGMTLVHTNVNPPIWLNDADANNTLEFVWSVPGMMGWATMVGSSRYNPEVAPGLIEFWRAVDDRVLSRTRTLSAPDTDVESLTKLEKLGA